MDDSTRDTRQPWRAWLPDVLTVAAIIAAVALALLLAGCGGSPSGPTPTTDSEGRPYFDLSAHGFSRQQAHSPQIRVKVSECGHGLPTGLPEG